MYKVGYVHYQPITYLHVPIKMLKSICYYITGFILTPLTLPIIPLPLCVEQGMIFLKHI